MAKGVRCAAIFRAGRPRFFALLRSRAQEHDEKRAPKSESAERQKARIHSVLFWLSCPGCPGCLVPAVLSRGYPVLAVLSCVSYSDCPVPSWQSCASFYLPCSGCTVPTVAFCLSFLAVLSFLSCLGSLLFPVLCLSWHSYPRSSVLAVLSWWSFPGSPVLAVLFCLFSPTCLILAVLLWMSVVAVLFPVFLAVLF